MAESSTGGASGYEVRQTPAETFFKPVASQAVQNSLSGGSAGAQIIGGQSRSGTTRPTVEAPQGWGELGNVIDKIMAPKVKAQQQQQWQPIRF